MALATIAAALGIHLGAVIHAAQVERVPVDVLAAICYYETRGHPDPTQALGQHGEIGLCQVRPETAELVGVAGDHTVPLVSARAAARWLARCINAQPSARVSQWALCYNEGVQGRGKTVYAARVSDMVMALRMQAALPNRHATRGLALWAR